MAQAQELGALGNSLAVELLALPFRQPDKVTDPLNVCQPAKRGNAFRVIAEAVRRGKRGRLMPAPPTCWTSGCRWS